MILEKSFVLFVVFSISHDIIKNKRFFPPYGKLFDPQRRILPTFHGFGHTSSAFFIFRGSIELPPDITDLLLQPFSALSFSNFVRSQIPIFFYV